MTTISLMMTMIHKHLQLVYRKQRERLHKIKLQKFQKHNFLMKVKKASWKMQSILEILLILLRSKQYKFKIYKVINPQVVRQTKE